MKYKKSVYRSLTLITQFGINMLVPIFLCVMAGVYIGNKFGINWITIPLFAIGALAGFRNIFIMAKKIYSEDTSSRRLSMSGSQNYEDKISHKHYDISRQSQSDKEKDTAYVKKD